jgi:hypothetical protein
MGSRLTEIVVDCHDPVAQAAFWAAALDYHVVRTEDTQSEPGTPTWARAGSPGWCSPTRKATSSASSVRSAPAPSQGRDDRGREAAGWA